MTTASGAERDPITARLAHNVPRMAVVYLVLAVPAWFRIDFLRTGSFGMVIWLLGFVVGIVMLVSLLHTTRADLCALCASEMPRDPQKDVACKRWALIFAHAVGTSALFTALLTFGLLAVAVWLVDISGWGLFYIPFDIYWAALCYSGWRHHYLTPWCPFCNGGWEDGGDLEVVPEPDPAGKGAR